MTETVAALLVFLSVSVFLAHAFDAYRNQKNEWEASLIGPFTGWRVELPWTSSC